MERKKKKMKRKPYHLLCYGNGALHMLIEKKKKLSVNERKLLGGRDFSKREIFF